jgi:hypothetical protein
MTGQPIRWRLLADDEPDPAWVSDQGESASSAFDDRHVRFAQKPARRSRKAAPGQLSLFTEGEAS